MDIFYKELSHEQIRQQISFHFLSLVSEVGGFLGNWSALCKNVLSNLMKFRHESFESMPNNIFIWFARVKHPMKVKTAIA